MENQIIRQSDLPRSVFPARLKTMNVLLFVLWVAVVVFMPAWRPCILEAAVGATYGALFVLLITRLYKTYLLEKVVVSRSNGADPNSLSWRKQLSMRSAWIYFFSALALMEIAIIGMPLLFKYIWHLYPTLPLPWARFALAKPDYFDSVPDQSGFAAMFVFWLVYGILWSRNISSWVKSLTENDAHS